MRFFISLFSLASIISCASVENRYVESLDKEDIREIKNVELSLLDYRFSKDPVLLLKIEARLNELLAGSIPNKEYKARLLGFQGQVLFYKNDIKALPQAIARIERESAQEARIFILKALLDNDRQKQIYILIEGLDKTDEKGLIALSLAEAYFEADDFRRALARYDEAFTNLDPKYRAYYQKKRDLAFQFMDRTAIKIETREILAKNELTTADVLLLTLKETRFFETVAQDKNIAPEVLAFRLKEKGFFGKSNPGVKEIMKRRDIAIMLLAILAYLENNPKLLEQSSGLHPGEYSSPVPDVLVNDDCYNAVIVLVQREIMDLPDGKNFFPNRSMSGLDYLNVLKKLKSLYRE
jgi:tetratricopeptide (TPR) repeat protein